MLDADVVDRPDDGDQSQPTTVPFEADEFKLIVAPLGMTGAVVLNALFEAEAAVIVIVGRITFDKVTGTGVTAEIPALVTFLR